MVTSDDTNQEGEGLEACIDVMLVCVINDCPTGSILGFFLFHNSVFEVFSHGQMTPCCLKEHNVTDAGLKLCALYRGRLLFLTLLSLGTQLTSLPSFDFLFCWMRRHELGILGVPSSSDLKNMRLKFILAEEERWKTPGGQKLGFVFLLAPVPAVH